MIFMRKPIFCSFPLEKVKRQKQPGAARTQPCFFKYSILKMHISFFQQAGNFSSFQLEGVLKRGKLNQRLDELRKEMNNRNSGELAGVAPQDSVDKNAAVKSQKILSEDSAHYILIKNNEREPEKDNQEAGKGRSCMQLILRIACFLTLEIDYFYSFFSDTFWILFLLSLTMVVDYVKTNS